MNPAVPDPRRWLILAVIALAQLMVVLDATIVNIALPRAQEALGISDADRQWVVTAYTLTFGGFLLLGGRIADYWGRKRTFMLGMLGFAAASAVGGLAQGPEMLYAARAFQGGFGALLAPAGLAILTTTFHDADERAKAFAVYGAIAAGGASIGLLLGGVLTEYLNWRWCLLVNTPVAIIAALWTHRVITESRSEERGHYDVPGAVIGTLGLVLLVYGFTHAGEESWGDPVTLAFLGAAVVLLAIFLVIESRSSHALLPMRILLDRNRGGSYITGALVGAAIFGSSLFLTYYFQTVLGYTPVKAGLASLPLSAGVLVAAGMCSRLLPMIGPKPLMITGSLLGAAGMFLLAQLEVDSGFAAHVLPGEVLFGLGMGLIFVPLANIALIGIDPDDAGAASAVLNTSQQVGGSLGVALLNSFYTSAAAAYFADNGPGQLARLESFVHGYDTAFYWAAGIMLLGAVVVGIFIRAGKKDFAALSAARSPAG